MCIYTIILMCQWAYNGILSFANVGNISISISIYICICIYIMYKYKYKYNRSIKSFCHLPFELSNCQGGLQCNVLSHFLPHGFHLLLHRLARFSSPTRNGRRARVAAPAPSFGWACPDGSFAMVIFEKQRTLFFLEEKVNIAKKHAWAMSQELGPCRSFCILSTSICFP